MLASRFALLGLVALALVGCEEVEPANPDEGGAPACCDAEPVCPVNAHEVDACLTDGCFTESACCNEKLCEPGVCDAERCQPHESEVESCDDPFSECRPVDLCGLTIYCRVTQCHGEASCDHGDVAVPDANGNVCPQGESCYLVEFCMDTVFCIDHGANHDCPDSPPLEQEPCNLYGLTCEYPRRDVECVETWTCQEPPPLPAPVVIDPYVWHLTDKSCNDPLGH